MTAHENSRMPTSAKTVSAQDLAEKCSALLTEIADTTARIMEVKKRTRSPIAINIVTLRTIRFSDDIRYEVMAYSNGVSQARINYDRSAVEPRRLSQNIFFRQITDTNGRQDYCLVSNVDDYLKNPPENLRGCQDPHPYDAPKLYRSVLVTAIRGQAQATLRAPSLPMERAFQLLENDNVLYGFITAHSMIPACFDDDWDLDILRTQASYVFDALDLWYRAYEAGNYSLVHVVPQPQPVGIREQSS
jgi:hypothetical protein